MNSIELQQEHSKMVVALSKPGEDIVSEMTPYKAVILHSAIGIAGEAGEIIEWAVRDTAQRDMENFIEELGDMEFFLEMARREMGCERDDILRLGEARQFIIAKDRVGCAALLSAHACVFLDAVKKETIYNKQGNLAKQIDALCEIEAAMAAIRDLHGVKRDETLRRNMKKLGDRYHEGRFSNEQAQKRADKKGD